MRCGTMSGRASFRLPTSDVSVVDLTVELEKPATYAEICAEMKRQAEGPMKRSEEHTSELQSLMRISYAVFCLKKKKIKKHPNTHAHTQTHIDAEHRN